MVTLPAAIRVSVPTTKGGREERPLRLSLYVAFCCFRICITCENKVFIMTNVVGQSERYAEIFIYLPVGMRTVCAA